MKQGDEILYIHVAASQVIQGAVMPYEMSIDIRGDGQQALQFAKRILVGAGFNITRSEQNRLCAENGQYILSSRVSPLRFMSHVEFEIRGNVLQVSAEFNAIRRLMVLIGGLLIVMAVAFVAFFSYLRREDESFQPYTVLVPFVPWVALLPLMSWFFEWQGKKALESLISGMKSETSPR